ncbi:MAG TPA: phospho-N-acetylmuramoyl-pentapeptide-transferase [Abditibacteriaceae bacterium]|nr:phospho-N-acetylmuramoyl-pentapeptide-transferase [Abditibacteriaceae bacterium]
MRSNFSATVFNAAMRHDWFLLLLLFACSCGLVLLVGNPTIAWIKNLRGMKWSAREDTPDSHQKKAGTPSMGGLAIIGSALFSVLGIVVLYAVLFVRSNPNTPIGGGGLVNSTWMEVGVESAESLVFLLLVAGFMLLGFADDWSKARGTGGLKARHKFAWQVVLSVAFLAFLVALVSLSLISVFGLTGSSASLLVGALLLLIFLIGTCNAVNLTDGLDGLAAGLTVIAGVALALCNDGALFDASWLSVALAGACLGFLAFNRYPARVFMGDTGSLAIGAGLGMCAILSRAVFLLPFIGFIFYIEMFSVIAQVFYFKYTKKKSGEGKRLFRRAPLHHHFELAGWSEWRVVITFWLINAITSLIGLLLWYSKLLPRWPNY